MIGGGRLASRRRRSAVCRRWTTRSRQDSQPQPGVPTGTVTQARARARKVFPGHAAQLSGLRPGAIRREPSDRLHDLPGRQRLRRQRRPRAGGPGQPDCAAGRAADDRDLRRPGHHAGAERSGAESLRAHLRVRLADAAVFEFPDRRARARGRRRATTSRRIRTITGSPASAPAASARSSPRGIVRISFAASSPGSAASATSGAPIACRA